jgi:hypothetical protein
MQEAADWVAEIDVRGLDIRRTGLATLRLRETDPMSTMRISIQQDGDRIPNTLLSWLHGRG